MELKINILELTIDEIVRKIKSIKLDPNLISLTLHVKRKYTKANKNHVYPQNMQLLSQPKILKDATNVGQYKNQQKQQEDIQDKDKQKQNARVGFDLAKRQTNIQSKHNQYVNDNRLIKAQHHYNEGTYITMDIGNYQTSISILAQLLQQLQTNQKQQIMQFNYMQGDKQRKLASVTFLLGNCYYRIKNYEKAIEYYSYQIPQQDYKHKAMRKSNIGAIYLHLNKNQQSLKNYTNALKIYGQCGCTQINLSNIYHNVGNIYQRQQMHEVAQKYYKMAIQERKNKSIDSQLSLFYSVYKLGVSQKYQQKYQQSINTLFYALSFVERGVGDCIEIYKEIAMIYQQLDRLNDALNYYQKICDNNKATQQIKGYAYQRAGQIYLKMMQQNQGKRILKIAEQYYEKSANQNKLSQIRERIKNIHIKNQD